MKKTLNYFRNIAFCWLVGIATLSFTNTQAQQSNFEIAQQEYATLAEQALNHVIKLDFDAWADMLADDVEFWFPDGDNNTRTKLVGKKAVIDWWKNWKATSGIKSMTMEEATFLGVNVLKATGGIKLTGNIVYSFFSNKVVFASGSTAIRMNFICHFNANKKIDRYVCYYDRSLIIKAMGKDLLQKK
jgi:ketosteroid isomerase-like protein